jgi:hypothetical protein
MKRRPFRLGWLIAVLAMAALACTCGALGQAQDAIQTAEAIGTQAGELATAAQGFATQVEGSGFEQTAEAIGTQSGDDGDLLLGDIPEDIPVYPENETMFALEGTISYFSPDSFQQVVDFYKQEMVNRGWSEASGSAETSDSVVLIYQKDSRRATVTINAAADQTAVLVVVEGN